MKGLKAIDHMTERLKKFQNNMDKYSIDAVVENENIVLDMVFDEQLDQGINGNNVPIADYQPYSPFTIMMKREKGQPVDRVTLHDEGDFYSARELKRNSNTNVEVISTDQKSDELQDKYGRDIFKLIPDNMQELRDFYVKPYLIKKLKE